MREILFRGKVIKSKNHEKFEENLYEIGSIEKGYYMGKGITGEHHIFDGNIAIPIDPETLGQYTGLLDKNGKKIFESDRVKIEGDNREFYVRWFDSMEFAFADCRSNYKDTFYDAYNTYRKGFPTEEQIEIIGNIHE